jgi:hypothetical protein
MAPNNNQMVKMPRSSLPVGTAMRPRIHDQYIWPYDPEAGGSTVERYSWTVQAFEWADRESGELVDLVVVQVIAASEAEAVAKAMQAVRRLGYRVAHVTELTA